MKIRGERHYLWRAVDQDGDVIEILVQRYRNARAAQPFFRRLLKGQESEPWRLVRDKLKSYGAAHRTTMPSVEHNTVRYANDRAEVSHQPTLTSLTAPLCGAGGGNSRALDSGGLRSVKWRRRRLVGFERHHRVDLHGPDGRDERREQTGAAHDEGDGERDKGTGGVDPFHERTGPRKKLVPGSQSDQGSDDSHGHTTQNDSPHDLAVRSSQGPSDAEFLATRH